MEVKGQWEIDPLNGQAKNKAKFKTEINDPVFFNMQFFVEREQYQKLNELCIVYKVNTIHELLQSLLNNTDPERLIELAGY